MERSCTKTTDCQEPCKEKVFTLFKNTPNEMKYPCCMCPHISTRMPSCPYDPNCSSANNCGAYLTNVNVMGRVLKCQKCKLCTKERIKINNSSDDYILF